MQGPFAFIEALGHAVQRRGIVGVLMLAVSKVWDWLFDLRYGTETGSWEEVARMSGTIGDASRAQAYQPTQVIALRKLLRLLELGTGRVLVDFGSGKGRVLMVAAPFGFRALRGVEFSAGLCDVARRNIERYRARSGTDADFEVIHADAAKYPVREDEDVFFLFNPFDGEVLAHVMANISRSYRARPRPMLLIYRRPVHEAQIVRGTPFCKVGSHDLWGSDFSVFAAGVEQQRDARPALSA
jgi:SAM-dependent methyltransferase